MSTRLAVRPFVQLLIAVGAAAIAADVVLAIRTGAGIDIGEGAALPTAFLLAGLLGGLARPDHRGIRLLLVLGAGHLAASALTGWAGQPGPSLVRWSAAVLGDAAYLVGFCALAVLLACYPDGRPASRLQRGFVRSVVVIGVVTFAATVLFSKSLTLAAGVGSSVVPAPAPLPLVDVDVDLLPVLLATVPAALAVLLLSRRRYSEAARRACGWAAIATTVLVVMIVSSPAADVVLPGVWDWAFPLVTTCVPFLLLAGLARYRLLEVDLLVVRTIARGVMVVTALTLAAVAEATLTAHVSAAAGAALIIAAALAGGPLLSVLERLVDRAVTGGRVGRDALRREVRLLTGDDAVAACRLIADGLDVSWVRLHWDGHDAVAGVPSGEPAHRARLATPTAEVGMLECGPRRGGWRASEIALLEGIADDLGLRLRDAVLSRRLQEQVHALEASRARLVQAEDAARRRVERDLHDGAQQQVVALLARIALARAQVAADAPAGRTLVVAHELAQQTLADLRLLVSGIAPPLLGSRGLVAAVRARAALLPIEVTMDVDPRIADERFLPETEGAAFFVIAEALANVMKHSGSDHARVVVGAVENGLRLAVVDEGNGCADEAGAGLSGLRERVEGLGGRLQVQAVPGIGTTISAELPTAGVPADV